MRKGRAYYVCPLCGDDCSLKFFLYMDAVLTSEILQRENKIKKEAECGLRTERNSVNGQVGG